MRLTGVLKMRLMPPRRRQSTPSTDATPLTETIVVTTEAAVKAFASIPVTTPGAYARDAGTASSHLYAEKWHARLGPIFRDADLGALFLASPVLCQILFSQGERLPRHLVPEAWNQHLRVTGRKRGLFFLDGEEWWQARQKLNPLLMKQASLQRLETQLEAGVEDLLNSWRTRQPDLEKDLYRWLTATMLRVLLGSELRVEEMLDLDELMEDLKGIFMATSELMLMCVVDAASRHLEPWDKLCRHTDRALDTMSRLVRESRGGLAREMISLGLSEEEVERFTADLLLAAIDTTSVTAVWLLYVLATQQAVQKRLWMEVAAKCGDDGGSGLAEPPAVRLADMGGLPLTKGLVKEVMRLYPAAPFLTRILGEPLMLGSYSLEAGTLVLVSTYRMGRDAALFPSPTAVSPERWLRTSEITPRDRVLQAYSSLPFGHGRRSCIGRRLAEQQLQLLAARLLQLWRLDTPTQGVEYVTRMIGVPNKAIQLQLRPRHHQNS